MKKSPDQPEVVFFRTELGWMGLVYQDRRIQKLTFGNETRDAAKARLDLSEIATVRPNPLTQPWIAQLKSYAAGSEYDFSGLPLDLDGKSEFQLAVIESCRSIPHGETVSYLELARLAGSVGAARAVGSVMSGNRIPLVIPCHRVVSSAGLGGFSAADGVSSKRRLLELEGNIKVNATQKLLSL